MGFADQNGGLSPADMAAVMNGNNGFGFGGDGAWWLLVLFLFAFNGNGWGNGVGGNGALPYLLNNGTNADVQRGFDQSALVNGIGNLQNTVSNGFANAAVGQCNQSMSMLEGFNALGNQISNSRFDLVNSITNAGYNLQNQMMNNEMARQQCCCDTKQAIADLKYTVATEACADRNAISHGLQQLLSSGNANTQAILANQTQGIQMILDKMCQQEIEALKTQNANLQTQLNMKELAVSQSNQTDQILSRLAPTPVPAYLYNSFGFNNPCGCGGSV